MTLSACSLSKGLSPALTAMPTTASAPAAAWQDIEDGLELRALYPGGEASQLIVLRIDPRRFHFRAHYRAGAPLSLDDWRALEADASVIINANFFDQADRVLGAVVSDGVRSGYAYQSRGGTFLVRNGAPHLVAFRSGPPPLDDRVEQAIQGFPLLVYDGAQAFTNANSGERNRRTVIAEDDQGNILIVVAPYFGLSLAELSAYLPAADLDIVTAINLDGGRSTMLAAPAADIALPSFDTVPTILAVYRR